MFPAIFLIATIGMLFKRRSCEEMVLNGMRLIFHAPAFLLHQMEFILSIIELIEKSNLNNSSINNVIQYTINILLIAFKTLPLFSNTRIIPLFFSHSVQFIGRHLVHVIIEPVAVEIIAVGAPLQ